MSGTRKLSKFELDRPDAFQSGTRRLDKFTPPQAALSIPTPVAEISAEILASARPSLVSAEEAVIIAPEQEPEPEHEPPCSNRTADREPGVEKLRTRLARKFTTLADQVTEGFGDFSIGGGWWNVELTAPEGMSTGGGKQMLQHLRLRPARQGHAVLVGGVVNGVTRTAELRQHGHMDMIYRARFGRPLEITAAEWEQFLRKAEQVLRQEQIQTTRIAVPRDLRMLAPRAPSAAEAGARRRTAAAVALGLSTAGAALVVWRVVVALWP